MSPLGLIGIPAAVVGTLVPGAAVGIAVGRAGKGSPAAVALLLLVGEAVLTWALMPVWGVQPLFGLSIYVFFVGRAARRLDPRARSLGGLLGLQPFADVEFPMVAPGVFAGSSFAFGAQIAARAPAFVGLPVGLLCALAALALDRQHAAALTEAGASRGSAGPVLLPHLSVAEHLSAVDVPPPAALADIAQRRPRGLTAEQRIMLAGLIPQPSGPQADAPRGSRPPG